MCKRRERSLPLSGGASVQDFLTFDGEILHHLSVVPGELDGLVQVLDRQAILSLQGAQTGQKVVGAGLAQARLQWESTLQNLCGAG